MYEADDRLISIISDNYNILQALGSFGINMGFGDKTVREVCEEQGVDCYTFLAVVNFAINGYRDIDDAERFSVPTLLNYLRASHAYYLEFEIPFIRRELDEALDYDNSLAQLILKAYDDFAHSLRLHMKYEEKTVFPYVDSLLNNRVEGNYDIEYFSKHHSQTNQKLKELKQIIIKYLPATGLGNNQLTHTLYDIYNCQEWLQQHAEVEDEIFIPVIRQLEKRIRQHDVTMKISNMVGKGQEQETLTDREKEVVIGVVQGLTNKEIADHLSISTNTVITHRKNIARKLQIHSPAGLTIYAIVNNLVDISAVKI